MHYNLYIIKSIFCPQLPPLKGVKPTAWHIAQPYYADGVQECIVVTFGGNAHVDKPTPGSRRHEVNSLRMFEFGK